MSKISFKQKQVLEFIREYVQLHHESPSQAEILQALKWKSTSRSLLYKYLNILEQKGYILRSRNGREISLVNNHEDDLIESLHVAILGITSAGDATSFAEENKIGELQIDKRLIKAKDYSKLFALKIQGDSMDKREISGTLLANNNFAIVEQTSTAHDGDVVLTIIENYATIKTFKRTKDKIILYPESSNPNHMPIYLDEKADFFIQGKVIAALENPV